MTVPNARSRRSEGAEAAAGAPGANGSAAGEWENGHVEGNGAGAPQLRAGSLALSVFATPLNTKALRALAAGPVRLADLRRATGNPPQTTLRGNLAALAGLGALRKQPREGAKGAVDNELTPLGHELLLVADALEAWLARAPQGPIEIDSDQGKAAIKALAGGWTSTALRALAAQPASLTELDRLIPEVSYPTLERRVNTMRDTGEIEPAAGEGGRRRARFAVTEWVRHAIAPLVAAGRCERRHLPDRAAPVTDIEVEAAFLLSLPLVSLPRNAAGACMLAVNVDGSDSAGKPRVAGVQLEVSAGRIDGYDPMAGTEPTTWALGTVDGWLDAVIDGRDERLRIGGREPQLPQRIVEGIHASLFE